MHALLASLILMATAGTPAATQPIPGPDEVIAEWSKPGSRPPSPERLAVLSRVIEAAVNREPSNNRWQLGMVFVERFQNKRAEQLERMKRVAAAEPSNAEYQFQLGQSYMSSFTQDMGMLAMASRAGDARDAWEQAIRIDPNHANGHYAAAQYYIQARKQGGVLFGSYAKAGEHGEALLKIPERRGEFFGRMVLAQVAGAQEKWDEMSRQFVAAESAPGDGANPSMALLAHANALLNDKKDAAAALPVLARLEPRADPKDTSFFFLRGMAQKTLGHCDAALDDFRRVLALNAEAKNTRFALAECLEKSGDAPGALAQYEEFAKRFPDDDRKKTALVAAKRLRPPAVQ